MPNRIILASNNPGKLKELRDMLAPAGFVVHSQSEYNVPEADEPYLTFVENALAKARHAARITGLPSLADDSGICVNALGGKPGVISARYGGEPKSDARNNMKLIEDLAPYEDMSANFYCVLVYLRHAEDPQPLIAEGRWHGQIIVEPRGQGGFGYDSHFLIPALEKTSAELAPTEKNRLSHRGQAMRILVEKLL